MPPHSVQQFQVCSEIVFLQLIFVNRIIYYTVYHCCITCYSSTFDNSLLSFFSQKNKKINNLNNQILLEFY